MPLQCSDSVTSRPPIPLETMTPQRRAFSSSGFRPLSATACFAAAMANWEKRPMRLASRLSSQASGFQSFTSAASFTRWSAVS